MPSYEDFARIRAERDVFQADNRDLTIDRDAWRERALSAEASRDHVAKRLDACSRSYLAVVDLMQRWLALDAPEMGRHYGESLRATLARAGRESDASDVQPAPETIPAAIDPRREMLALVIAAARGSRDGYVLSGLAEHEAMSTGWERFADALERALNTDGAHGERGRG